MTLYVHIVQESSVRLWGLSSRQRLMRVLKSAGVTEVVDDIASVPKNCSILLLRADFLFEDRVINYMVQMPDILLRIADDQTNTIVAAHVSSTMARQARDIVAGTAVAETLQGVRTENLETLSISFQRRLRKFEPPVVLPITSQNSRILERRLFD